ncbi:MAG: serine hydrolase [Candidatus Marinimicrobia bacterium]|nr:serine hydrolase [Candidatus Neomarinimicrobiota bacterium]
MILKPAFRKLLIGLFCLTFIFGQSLVAGDHLVSGQAQNAGFNLEKLRRVDAVIQQHISDGKIPGATLLVARKGYIAYRKAYGNAQITPTVEKISEETIFDMASCTKPVATASSIMLLVEEGKLRLLDPVKQFIPEYTDFVDSAGNTGDPIRIYHLLTHTSGLPPYTDVSALKAQFGSPCPEQVIQKIATIKKQNPTGTVFDYSCLGYITLAEIIHRMTGKTIDEFSQERIFTPLGMKNTMFCPPEKFLPRIAPTEVIDGKPLRGFVHDPLAQLMDGKSGNAGLFSTIDDMAIFCQMLLNGGTYGGIRLFSPLTVQAMTSVYSDLAFAGRGLGWDLNSAYNSNLGDLFPEGTFGHTGFTGTSICVDPKTETIVILLTNAVHIPTGNAIRLRSLVTNIVASSIVKF